MTAPTRDLSFNATDNATALPVAATTARSPELSIAPRSVADAPAIADETLAADPVLYTYKRAPVELVRGEGVYLFDSAGKRYLDFVSGIAVNALGYGDEGLVAELHAAADRLVHVSNLYETSPAKQLAQLLVDHSFASKVFFCNSGAEANEGAFKFARRWARNEGDAKHEIIALRGAFHGRLFATLAATDRPCIGFLSGRSPAVSPFSSETWMISPSRWTRKPSRP